MNGLPQLKEQLVPDKIPPDPCIGVVLFFFWLSIIILISVQYTVVNNYLPLQLANTIVYLYKYLKNNGHWVNIQ